MHFFLSLVFVSSSKHHCLQQADNNNNNNTLRYFVPMTTLYVWLANFASSDWSIPGPITYDTDPEGPVTFAFFRFWLHLYVV